MRCLCSTEQLHALPLPVSYPVLRTYIRVRVVSPFPGKCTRLFSWADYRLTCSVFLDGCVLLTSVPRQPTPESTIY